MHGAIVGDIIGSVHEGRGTKTKKFPLFTPESRFTDDSVLTIAVADALLTGKSYTDALQEYARGYPHAGYGGMFIRWALQSRREPYQSFGNGSAMRVSPVAYRFDTIEEVLKQAEASAAVTHDHPEGIKGAQAVALAMFLARTGCEKPEIRARIRDRFQYALDQPLDEIRPNYTFEVSCQQTVPQAIQAFLESADFEDSIRNAISLGGDADTMACIAGAIAEAYYGGVPDDIAHVALSRLEPPLLDVAQRFHDRWVAPCLANAPKRPSDQ